LVLQQKYRKRYSVFYTGDASSIRKYAGTGLGLVLVKQFIGMHKGTAWLESEEGKSSTFTLHH